MKNRFFVLVTTLICSTLPTYANDTYVVGLSAAVDSAEGVSVNALLDYGFSDRTSLTFNAGVTRADGDPVAIQTTLWDLALNYDFGPVGLKTAVGQWGDSDEYTSDSWSVGLFRTFGAWRISTDYLHHELDLTFRSTQNSNTTSTVNARSEGTAATISYAVDSGRAFYLSAVRYDYNRNVTRLNQFRIARLLSPTSLTLSGSLLNHSLSAGGDWPIGDNLLSLTVARDRTAVDRVDVDSVTLGWLTPIGDLTDLDISVGVSQDGEDTQYFVSLLFLRYGVTD